MFTRNGVDKISLALALLLLVTMFGGTAISAEHKKRAAPGEHVSESYSPSPGYTIKPSEVSVPADVPVGQYRRIMQPFPNWTLICDENLVKKERICNISQTITNPEGVVVFSWSLAATENGKPFLILRTPPVMSSNRNIMLGLNDGGRTITLPVKGCTGSVCIGYQPVTARLRAAIKNGVAVQVSYVAGSSGTLVNFRVPFAGLAAALAAI